MNYQRICLFLLSLIFGFASLSAEAQVSDNNYCHNVATTSNNCFGSQEAAEAAMKALLPASYRDVIQPKTPAPSGFQPNAQGLELWKIDYFIPDQPPERMFPQGYANGSGGAPTQCVSAGDPFSPALCSSESGAAYGLYNAYIAGNPQCSYNDLGFQGAYATPFSRIDARGYRDRYGTIEYTPNGFYTTLQLAFTTLCPGWHAPTKAYIYGSS